MAFNVKYVYDLVDKISPSLKKIDANMKRVGASVQNSARKIGASFDKVKNKVSQLGQKTAALGKSLLLKVTLPLGAMGVASIKAASDFEESLNKVEVAFGSAGASVREFAKNAGNDFGIDRGRALDMAALFGDMSTSMGLSQDRAAELSIELAGLAGDLASFKNVGVEQATTALAGVFTGETESLKRLGVVMTETNLKQFALSKGITKNIKDFSQADKVLLRYQFIMNKTKNAQGDFARTSDGFANKFRQLQSSFNDLRITVGQALLPVATKLVNFLIKIIDKFNKLSPTTQKIVVILGSLAAILPPLLIGFGLLVAAITALASPIGLIVVGLTALGALGAFITAKWDVLVESFKLALDPLFKLVGALKMVFDWMMKIKEKVLDKFISGFAKVKSFLGVGRGDELDAIDNSVVTQQINQNVNANSNQNVVLGGELGININGLPKGSNTRFTPVADSPLKVGINQVFAGS